MMKEYCPTAHADKIYYKSGRWKCDKSPSGAHYWLVRTHDMECKYCHEVRQLKQVTKRLSFQTARG